MSDEEVARANTVEAYTFLARHLLTEFPRQILDHRPRRILRHALEHITGDDRPNLLQSWWRAVTG